MNGTWASKVVKGRDGMSVAENGKGIRESRIRVGGYGKRKRYYISGGWLEAKRNAPIAEFTLNC